MKEKRIVERNEEWMREQREIPDDEESHGSGDGSRE